MTRRELRWATSTELDSLLVGARGRARYRILDPLKLARDYSRLIREGRWDEIGPDVLVSLLRALSDSALRNLDRPARQPQPGIEPTELGIEPTLSGADAQRALSEIFSALAHKRRGAPARATLHEGRIVKAWEGVYARKILGKNVRKGRPGDSHRKRAELFLAVFDLLNPEGRIDAARKRRALKIVGSHRVLDNVEAVGLVISAAAARRHATAITTETFPIKIATLRKSLSRVRQAHK